MARVLKRLVKAKAKVASNSMLSNNVDSQASKPSMMRVL
jgi:hypothetical protein